MISRRQLLIALGVNAVAAPFATFAQPQGKVWRIGLLSTYPYGKNPRLGAFKQQLRDLGHVEGKTFTIDELQADGNYDRYPALAAELVRRNVDVILATGGTQSVTAARDATRTIPIVFSGVSDPVGQKIVASLARPGGNITGATNQNQDAAGRVLALLREIVPSAKRIAILSNPTNSSLPLVLGHMRAAATTLRLEVTVVEAKAPAEFEEAFAKIARARTAGVIVPGDSMFNGQSARLAALAVKHRLPTMGGNSLMSEGGVLMSYSANPMELFRRVAILTDKILRGAKPADLPVEQPTQFDLIVNMKTAKALGIKIPNSILVQATKVIE